MRKKRKVLLSILSIGILFMAQKVDAIDLGGGGGEVEISELEYNITVKYIDTSGSAIDTSLDYTDKLVGTAQTYTALTKNIIDYTYDGYFVEDQKGVNNKGSQNSLIMTHPATITAMQGGEDTTMGIGSYTFKMVYRYTPTVSKYTLTYDANTGTGTVTDATQYDENTSATVKDVTGITKTGYTFSGWNTKADGTGITYAANATILMDANKILYAKWIVNTYTIDYDKNGGKGELKDTTTTPPGEPTTVKGIEGVTKPGNKFVEWNTEPDGSGTTYKPGDKVTLTGNVKLYAQWKAIDSENKVVDLKKNTSGNNTLPKTGNNIIDGVMMLLLTSGFALTTRKIYMNTK